MDPLLRNVRLATSHTLEVSDTYRVDSHGKSILSYSFRDAAGKVARCGESRASAESSAGSILVPSTKRSR
jgi:hypothetical protein